MREGKTVERSTQEVRQLPIVESPIDNAQVDRANRFERMACTLTLRGQALSKRVEHRETRLFPELPSYSTPDRRAEVFEVRRVDWIKNIHGMAKLIQASQCCDSNAVCKLI